MGLENELVIVYNPTLEAYQEIRAIEMQRQMESFGIEEKEIEAKIEEKIVEKYENIGLFDKEIESRLLRLKSDLKNASIKQVDMEKV